jgi:apolipoprotein N-acyltransferase
LARLSFGAQLAASLAAGAISSLAFAPHFLWPLYLVGIAPLVGLLDASAGPRRAALLGWAFGIGHFALGLRWLAVAFEFQAAMPAWLGWIAVVALAAVLAIYTALVLALAAALWSPGPSRVLVLAAAWALGEWLRGRLLTGFPWNTAAQIWADTPAVLQVASLAGGFGLSFLTVAAFAALAAVGDGTRAGRRSALAALILGAGIVGFGVLRVPAAAGPFPADPLALHIVQADVRQDIKWDAGRQLEILERYEGMTRQALAARGPGLVIWPETATLYDVTDAQTRQRLARLLPAGGRLVLGAMRPVRQDGRMRGARNSLVVLDARGAVEAAYDKAHLVPFGEYLPARGWLTQLGLSRLVPGAIDFIPGQGTVTLAVPGMPAFSPLICYEIIFANRAVDPARRPGWLLNLSNDAWFGMSSGPHQHLAQARLRAVEQGLPVVRATPTGISAVIDPYGRLMRQLPLGARGVLTSELPAALSSTVYARAGDGPLLALVALGLGAGLRGRRRRTRLNTG